eukprot:gene1967-2238_t
MCYFFCIKYSMYAILMSLMYSAVGNHALKSMALSESFLSVETEDTENCLLCDKKTVYPKVIGVPSAIFCHETCRINFGTRYRRYVEKYGLSELEVDGRTSLENSEESSGDNRLHTCSSTSYLQEKRLCFVCNSQRSSDSNQYNQGGLGRCSTVNSVKKLREALGRHIADESNRCFQAARRLKLLQCGQSHDLFAIDVYYHQSCYLKFSKTQKDTNDANDRIQKDVQAMVLAEFDITIKVNILGKKCAYLLSCLLKDIIYLSEEHGIEPVIAHSLTLRKHLEINFPDVVGFFSSGKQVIVYSSDTNPCEYAVAALKGVGLRDTDLIKSFANMIKRKIGNYEKGSKKKFPVSISDAMSIDSEDDVIPELYNAIFLTLHSSCKMNEKGYAVTKAKNPMLPGETPDLQDNEQLPDSLKLSVLDAKSSKNKDYRIGKLIEPHRLENFTDKDDYDILAQSFDKDLVWGIAGGLPQPDTGNEEYPQIGSWTAFQKQSIENSSCEASEDDEEWEHLSDFLSDSSDSDNSGSDWAPF